MNHHTVFLVAIFLGLTLVTLPSLAAAQTDDAVQTGATGDEPRPKRPSMAPT